MPPQRNGTPLDGLHILALGHDVATRFAASWLAESGAHIALFRPDWQPPEAASSEAAFERQAARATQLADFTSDAPYDILLGDTASLDQLRPRVPAHLLDGASTIEVTSPFPASTDFDDALLADMALWARSGLGYITREVHEDLQLGAPAIPLNRQPSILAGIAAATAAAGLAIERLATPEQPRHVSLDKLELLAGFPMQPIAFAQMDGRIVGQDATLTGPGGTVSTANGLAFVRPVEPDHWAKLLRLVGELDWAADQVEANPALIREAADELDRRIRHWASRLTSEDIADLCQAEHIPVAPIYTPHQLLADQHLAARDFFRTDPATPSDRGLNPPWLVTTGEPTSDQQAPEQPATPVRPTSGLPLEGLRVLDLTWAWAGPFATTMLADLGAEVVNVEWHPRASNLRRNPPYAQDRDESHNTAGWWSANQRGKLSIGVNLKTPEGKQLIKDLVAHSDVVVENFSPGVVNRLGVGYEDLIQANPRLVYVSLSAFGQTGPHSHYIGYGTQLYAASGASYATSPTGETFSHMWIPYPDPVSGLVGVYAILSHVHQARATGRPAFVDLSELEALASITPEPLLEALAAGDTPEPSVAAATREAATYLTVTTADDHFVALLARTDAEWPAFRAALGTSDDPDTPTALRAAAQTLNATQLLDRLAAANLLATPVHHSAEVLDDPYLTTRNFWLPDQSPEVAPTGTRIAAPIFHIDARRAPVWRGAPQLFADTRPVLQQLLDYAPTTIDNLLTTGAVE